MAATAAQIAQVRRMVNESTEETYTDEDIQGYIEAYPLMDERGEEPYTWDTSTQPPTQDENDDWIDTYDLAAAAADIWDEKAAVVAQDYSFSADGGRFSREQVLKQYEGRARYYRSRRAPRARRMFMSPKPSNPQAESWIGNLPEED